MKLERTTRIHFGWILLVPFVDVLFLLTGFLLLSSNFLIQHGVAVSPPSSSFLLAPQPNQEIISITGGTNATVYFRDQRVTLEQLATMLEQTKKEGRPIIIRADKITPLDEVMRVSNLVLEHGITSVSLATAPAR